jgi:FtsZ-binding cell division protein ZapB
MKQTTKKALIDALERLIKGEPTNIELKKKAKQGKLKINNNTVEKEAGLSVGTLRNHPDIKQVIKAKSLKAKVKSSPSSISEIDLLQKEIEDVKSERTQLKKLKTKHLAASRKNEEALAEQAARHINMVKSLMEMIPECEREKAMDKVVHARADNIVQGTFNKQ